MKRISYVAMVLALAATVSLNWASARPAQVSGDLLQLLPDGNAVVVVDFQKISSNSLWPALSGRNPVKGIIQGMESGLSEIGMKAADIRSVAIAFQETGFNNPTIAIQGAFNQDDLLARLRANQRVKLTSERYKDFELYTVRDLNESKAKKQDIAFVIYDASTVVVGSPSGVRGSVDVRTGSAAGVLSQNAKLGSILGENPASAIRFALVVTPSMAGALQTNQVPLPDFSSIKLVFGAVDLTSGIDLKATLRNDTAEHAKAIADQLNGLLGMARGFFGSSNDPKMAALVEALKSISISGADADVKITGSLPQEALTQVLR